VHGKILNFQVQLNIQMKSPKYKKKSHLENNAADMRREAESLLQYYVSNQPLTIPY